MSRFYIIKVDGADTFHDTPYIYYIYIHMGADRICKSKNYENALRRDESAIEVRPCDKDLL